MTILREIADGLHSRPLAAIIAIRYITRVIAQEGSGSSEKDFLIYFMLELQLERSIISVIPKNRTDLRTAE
jgi:hypothetical protein